MSDRRAGEVSLPVVGWKVQGRSSSLPMIALEVLWKYKALELAVRVERKVNGRILGFPKILEHLLWFPG